jgi:hypothetical protein
MGMSKNILGVIIFCFASAMAFAQQSEQCGQSAYVKYLESINPGITDNINETFFDALKQSKLKTKRIQDTVYTIKVVFHIVYGSQAENLPDAYITSQMKVLNDAFRRTNADTINTRDIFKPVAGDAGINFELADEDPDGNPTNGIVRVKTNLISFGTFPTNLGQADRVKEVQSGSPSWDTDKYMNIWVCDLSANGFDALLGYAYPPTGAPNWNGNSVTTSDKQGVVVHYKVVGEENPNSLSTGAKTTVHEVGHYLGLRHIWGDGGCGVDDFMDDTPRARRASNGCNKGVNTCAEPFGEEFPDMMENYMDYSTGECQNLFTNDQIAQMRSNLVTFREGIYSTFIPEPEFPELTSNKTGVFPNPAVNEVLVQLTDVDVAVTDYSIEIINTLGQTVMVRDLLSQEKQFLGGLNGLSGTYIYRIRQGDAVLVTQKILFGH